MNGFLSGFQKFFNKDRVMLLGIFLCLAVFLMSYSNGKLMVIDTMENGTLPQSPPSSESTRKEQIPQRDTPESSQLAPPSMYAAKPVANPSDLLPTDKNSQWASLNPVDSSNPQMPDLLKAGHHIGLDTIGNTLRNANLQLRSDPIIPKQDIGPWNQSTIEADLMRVPLEVGNH
jgi:hypothetical protein